MWWTPVGTVQKQLWGGPQVGILPLVISVRSKVPSYAVHYPISEPSQSSHMTQLSLQEANLQVHWVDVWSNPSTLPILPSPSFPLFSSPLHSSFPLLSALFFSTCFSVFHFPCISWCYLSILFLRIHLYSPPYFISIVIPFLLLSSPTSVGFFFPIFSHSKALIHHVPSPLLLLSIVSSPCTIILFSYNSSPWNVFKPGNCAFLLHIYAYAAPICVLRVRSEHRRRIHFPPWTPTVARLCWCINA